MSTDPAVHIPTETEIYIFVNGTCTAAPGEELFGVLGEISGGKRKLGKFNERTVSGGGTVSIVKSKDATFFVGLGDFSDLGTLHYSADVEKGYRHLKGLNGGIVLHTHPDHISFRNLYSVTRLGGLPVYKSANDRLLKVVLDKNGYDESKIDRRMFDAYSMHRQFSMTDDDFVPTDPKNEKIPWLPDYMELFSTPGHDDSCMALYIDGHVTVKNIETGKEMKSAHGAVIEDDNLCDSRYIWCSMNGDRRSVYDMSSFNPRIGDPAADLASQKEILERAGEYGIIIPGHGEPCTQNYLRNNPPTFKTTYAIHF